MPNIVIRRINPQPRRFAVVPQVKPVFDDDDDIPLPKPKIPTKQSLTKVEYNVSGKVTAKDKIKLDKEQARIAKQEQYARDSTSWDSAQSLFGERADEIM